VSSIPNRFHFVFGLKPQTEPFHVAHYLCLESCIRVNRPDRVDFHYHYEPHGGWWDRIKPRLRLQTVELESFVRDHPSYFTHEEGQFIKGWNLDYAHQSDFLRLRILLERGGVYADMDTIFVNPLPPELFEERFVIGEEDPVLIPGEGTPRESLCNAFLMAAPGAEFGRLWLERMHMVFDGTWSRHSCAEAARLRSLAPDSVHVVPKQCFYKHPCTPEGIQTLLEGLDDDFEGVSSMHLWAHLWWSRLRNDFSAFHAGQLTEDYIRSVDTTYNVVARRFLDPTP
jgi:hypothetical protein